VLSKTLETGLAEYRIGPKVRGYRKRKNLSLAELSAHTGLSSAMLSKIERGQLFPTLPTLLRIALVFGVGLEQFFVEGEKSAVAVTRSKKRIRLPDYDGNPSPTYLFESLNYPLHDRGFEAYLAEFAPGLAPSDPHSHDGSELVYILDGRLSVSIDGDQHVLGPGDAICFDSGVEHSYRCDGNRRARVLVAVTP
jgi:quercetin dioxygenase-like cupin family protein/DNA-binding XRE family transcriptional regulator